jgi:thiol reductant ABC exporter CydD subunit
MIDHRLLNRARTARGALVRVVVLSAGAGLFTLGQAWFLSTALDQAFLQDADLSALAHPLGALLFLSLCRAAVVYGTETAASRLAVRVKAVLRHALLDHLVALGPVHTLGERTGELSTTAVEGIESLDAYFRQYLPQLVVAVLIPLLLLAVVLPTDPASGLVLALTAPLLPLFMVLIGRTTERLTRRQYGLLSTLSAHFLDILHGLTTLKLLDRSRAQAEVIREIGDRYRAATLEVLRVAFLSALALEMVATISTALVAVQVGLRLLYGRMLFREAMFVLILAPEFYLPLRGLGARFHASASGSAAAQRIFDELAKPHPPRGPAIPAEPSQPTPAPSRFAITFDDVHVEYPDSRHALQGASFDILPQALTALVGPSGGGKTTVASLLLRFIEPTGGRILVDGLPLHTYAVEAWRSWVAWVPESPHLFAGSIASNLRLAKPEATDAELIAALELAQLGELLATLPAGLDTPVGEGGSRLSAGQAQRLALARAFLRDAPFLILDEPTSAVDPGLEDQLRAATEQLMRGRTGLVIAHRTSTVYRADRILVMARGRVVESGTHPGLWKAGGLYRRMLDQLEAGA